MQRRKFLKHTSIATLAYNFVPSLAFGNKLLTKNTTSTLIPLADTSWQIRHGALNFLPALDQQQSLAFDWIVDIHRNIFLKNGFQRDGDADLDIISIALKDQEKEGIRSMQIQLAKDQVKVMWQDQFVATACTNGLQQIALSDDDYCLELICLTANQAFEFVSKKEKEYFVEILDGAVQFGDFELTTQLGLILESGIKITIKALEQPSRILIISK